MEYKSVVVLGRQGVPGPFSLGQSHSRHMEIHDDNGDVAYRERVPSLYAVLDHTNYEVFDRYIKAAGYKRTGEWQDPPRYEDGTIRKWEEAIAPVVPRRRITGKGWAYIAVGIAVLMFVVFGNIANENAKRIPSQSEARSEATQYCHESVMDQLTASSKVAFSGEKTTGSGRSWKATGFFEIGNNSVDKTKYRYWCQVKYSTITRSWDGSASFKRVFPGLNE